MKLAERIKQIAKETGETEASVAAKAGLFSAIDHAVALGQQLQSELCERDDNGQLTNH